MLYVGLALFGTLFLLIQLLLGHGHGELQTDVGSDFDVNFDTDVDLHLDTDIGHDADFGHSHFDVNGPSVSFLTPLIIAPALAGIGVVGVAATMGLGLPLLLHLPLALAGGVLTGGALYYLLARVLAPMQGSSEVRISELWGTVAEVVTPIPAGRSGEIRFIAQGSYLSVPARAVTGEAIPRGQPVIIERVEDSVAYVRKTL